MGYCYSRTGGLVCGGCGQPGARKRRCAYTVLCDSIRGARQRLDYCSPPALCSRCYKAAGGLRGVHGQACKDGAAASQAAADSVESRLDDGEAFVIVAFGAGDRGVPAGLVGVGFRSRAGESWRLVPEDDYADRAEYAALADFPGARPWPGHPAARAA